MSSSLTPVAEDLRHAFTTVAKATRPFVVSILKEQTAIFRAQSPAVDALFDYLFHTPDESGGSTRPLFYRQRVLGSGFVIRADGYILTTSHVVDGHDKLTVGISGREYPAQLVGSRSESDLAVIRIRATEPLQALPTGDSDAVELGAWVVAVGAPFGLEPSITAGIVSAKGPRRAGMAKYDSLLQTDAAIHHGSSGGPLVDLDGRVVGINTDIYPQTEGYEGRDFAIPINLAREVSQALIADGK